jgi:hypothetical protein
MDIWQNFLMAGRSNRVFEDQATGRRGLKGVGKGPAHPWQKSQGK